MIKLKNCIHYIILYYIISGEPWFPLKLREPTVPLKPLPLNGTNGSQLKEGGSGEP